MTGDLVLRGQVESLYRQAAASDQEFCIDLEGETPLGTPVWHWMGYSTKGNATRSLSKLIEGVDYHLSEVISGAGGLPRQIIRFSRDGFKQWGMLAGTDRGRQIRLYFIECEKRLQLGMSQPTTLNATMDRLAQTVERGLAGLYHSNQEIKQELGDLGQRVARLEEQQCDQLYVCVRSSDLTVKIGYSQNLEVRLKAHTKRGFKFQGSTPGTRRRESQIKEALRRKGFAPKNGTEEYQLSAELIEAMAQEGLPIGDMCCTPPANASPSVKKTKDSVTPFLFDGFTS